MSRSPFLLLLLVALSLGIVSCGEVDIKLVNQIKTFGPKWSVLGEKLDFVDRNVSFLERRMNKDIEELKPLFATAEASEKDGQFWRGIKEYEAKTAMVDSLRGIYVDNQLLYSDAVTSFNDWEKKVMDNEIATGIANSDLTKFKQTYNDIDSDMDAAKRELEAIKNTHNRVLRDICEALEVYTNYDIELK